MAHCCSSKNRGQRRGPIVSHLPRASGSPSPKDLPLRAARGFCSHVCVCHSVLKSCMSLCTLTGSARCSNTLSWKCVLQRTSARQPWQPLSRQNQKWCFCVYEDDAQRKFTHLSSLQHLGKITVLRAARQPWQPWPAKVQK